jgi:ATP-dependent Clp protease ATP-binding subunit ClpC
MSKDPADLTNLEEAREHLAVLTGSNGVVRNVDGEAMSNFLKQGVKGQDHIIDDLVTVIRQNWGSSNRDRPIANLLFAGLAGTGKSELATAITRFLYKDVKGLLRFQCNQLQSPESHHVLIGVPKGYSGWEKGGELTRPMLANKRRVILFDEIEKAHVNVHQQLLSMMGEGAQLTELGSGKTADFTETIIILTGNPEYDELIKLQEQDPNPRTLMRAIRTHLTVAKVFSPELITRFDRVYVFKPLDDEALIEIASIKAAKVVDAYGMSLDQVSAALVAEVVHNARYDPGARAIEAEARFLLADHLIEAKNLGLINKPIRISRSRAGQIQIEAIF